MLELVFLGGTKQSHSRAGRRVAPDCFVSRNDGETDDDDDDDIFWVAGIARVRNMGYPVLYTQMITKYWRLLRASQEQRF